MPASEPLRLHLGGWEPREGWKIVNVQPLPSVDFIANVMDLSQFWDGTVAEVYASHVYEHLGYQAQLPTALGEAFRVLAPGGRFRAGVPDLDVLCRFILDAALTFDERFHVQRMMFGGQMDEHDFHFVGLTFEFFKRYLEAAGFERVSRVGDFGLFKDTSGLEFKGVKISLNVEAYKPASR